jgi:hypothetical protein
MLIFEIFAFFVVKINQAIDTQHCSPPQQPLERPSMVFKIPTAQPTPFCTKMAPTGQFRAQAPHSMQASRDTITAFRLSS